MPTREIRRKFTFSELAIMSWRSREMSANLSKGRKKPSVVDAPETPTVKATLPDYGLQNTQKQPHIKIVEHENSYELPEGYNNGVAIPKDFFNEEGDLDLSKTTGPNAVKYLNALGFSIPTIFR